MTTPPSADALSIDRERIELEREKLSFERDKSALEHQRLVTEKRFERWKWAIGTVGVAVVTLIGGWTFQALQAGVTHREVAIKEQDMQLQFLEAFTNYAIDDDIYKRVRFAHYMARTIDPGRFNTLRTSWNTYYDELVEVCLEAAAVDELEADCRIGGRDQSRTLQSILNEDGIDRIAECALIVGAPDDLTLPQLLNDPEYEELRQRVADCAIH